MLKTMFLISMSACALRRILDFCKFATNFRIMPPGHKMLLRYKTLNECFLSSKKWNIEMLIIHCSKVLGEKISKRSIQSDIQFLRDNGAPIIVQDKKYYTYENKSYNFFKAKTPEKLEAQFIECINFVKDMSVFPKYKHYKDSLRIITTKEDKTVDSVKLCEQQLNEFGYFINNAVFSAAEVRRILALVRSHQVKNDDSISKDKILLKNVLTSKIKSIVKKISPHTFLVDAVFNAEQHPSDFQQLLNLPFRQRKIPQNLTLWGYPTEEKYEKPDKEALYAKTFAIQIFLKDVTRNTGALEVISGSHQRELSPLETNLITRNVSASACEVKKGGIVGYKPMLIKSVLKSESPKNKQSITLWFSSYHLPVHYLWNNEINL